MKRYIKSSSIENYAVIPWDNPSDIHYFATYVEALQYGDKHYNGCCDIEEI